MSSSPPKIFPITIANSSTVHGALTATTTTTTHRDTHKENEQIITLLIILLTNGINVTKSIHLQTPARPPTLIDLRFLMEITHILTHLFKCKKNWFSLERFLTEESLSFEMAID